METLTVITAKEMRECSITVDAAASGLTATDLSSTANRTSYELVERIARMNPLERLGTSENIAAAFLAGRPAAGSTARLRANGDII